MSSIDAGDQSGLSQLVGNGNGEHLPADWQSLRLCEVAKLTRGISWGKADEAPDGVPVIAIPNVRRGTVDFDVKYRIAKEISSAKALHEGDILLVGSSGSVHNVGRTALVGQMPFQEATFASFLVKAEPTQSVTRDFLYFLLSSNVLDFPGCSKRAADGKFNLQVKQLGNEQIPVPPLPEQRAIAHVLRAVQRAKEATEKVIAATRQLKQSLMRHLFTYGPVPVDQADQVELKETDMGPAPMSWKLIRLGEVIVDGPQNGLYKHASAYGSGTPILRIDDFDNDGSVVVGARNRLRLSPDELARYELRENDIVVNRVNSLSHLGKTALVGQLSEPAVYESNMMRFRVNRKMADPRFVFRFLTSPQCRNYFRGVAKRAVAQSSINQGDVEATLLPQPPPGEQQQIADALDAVDNKAAAEEMQRNALDALFQTLLHNLMTGRVRVNHLAASVPAEVV